MSVTAGSTLDELWAECHRLDRLMASKASATDDAGIAEHTAARDCWFMVKRWIGLHEAARRGIARLNRMAVDAWGLRVPLARLDMGIGFVRDREDCGCTLAHLYGDYHRGLNVLDLTPTQAVTFGFSIATDDESVSWDRRMDELTAAWRTELAAA